MANIRNNVSLIGKVVATPNMVVHSDGSKTVFLKLAVMDNFKSKNVKRQDGTMGEGYATQFITTQGFISATPKNPKYPDGVYGLLETGMEIGITGHLASYIVPNGAKDRDGNPCNRWEQCVRIDGVQLLETKTQKAVRQAKQAEKRVAAAAAAAAPAAAAPASAGVYEGEIPEELFA